MRNDMEIIRKLDGRYQDAYYLYEGLKATSDYITPVKAVRLA